VTTPTTPAAPAATTDWAPHTSETRPWQQRVARGPRADRQVREVTVSLPPYIARSEYAMDRPLAAMTAASAGDLTHLDLVHGRTLAALNHLQLRTEAIDSSRIEDVEAGLADYGRAVLGVGASASAVSMAAATAAVSRLVEDAATTRRIRLEAILAAHAELFRRDPEQAPRAGRLRTTQNWVGGSDWSPRGALHVPPPPETVPGYLDDLLAFANRDDVPPLAQTAIVHAQFESIHPFIDGNGRLGRALIHAVLRRRRVSRHLVVPVASGLVADRDGYFAALGDYRRGRARTLVTLLSIATTTATRESARSAVTIGEIRRQWGEAVGGTRPGTPLHRLLDLLTEQPILNQALVSEHLGLGEADAYAAIETLHDARVLRRAPRSRRAPVWLAPAVLHEVEDLSARIDRACRAWSSRP